VDSGGQTGVRPELLSRDTSTATADGQAKEKKRKEKEKRNCARQLTGSLKPDP
jgi:hypothetical protein